MVLPWNMRIIVRLFDDYDCDDDELPWGDTKRKHGIG